MRCHICVQPTSSDLPSSLNPVLKAISFILLFLTLCFCFHQLLSPRSDSCVNVPLLVASSSNVVSTFLAAILTYRTTDPRMKQFFTAIYELASSCSLVPHISYFIRALNHITQRSSPVADIPSCLYFNL